jgi:RHS repeat-associated protein
VYINSLLTAGSKRLPRENNTTYSYDPVGNRKSMEYNLNGADGFEIKTNYVYDAVNRLTDLTHEDTAGQLASYDYGLAADSQRISLDEEIKLAGGTTETHNINYGYDALNRLTDESADSGEEGYESKYTYDLAGNRTKRIISANGQCMQTDYEYNDRDQLVKEAHTDPGVCFYLDGKPVYAYSTNGRITHYRLYGSSEDIGPLKAFLLGIPTKWSNYVMTAIFGLLAAVLLLPVFIGHRSHSPGDSLRRVRRVKYLLRQLLILLLAYLMFIDPAYLQQVAQASIDYSNLSRADWGIVDTDIHYRYDANGSQTEKIVADKDEPDPDNNFIEKTVYTYNLRNQLEMVEFTTDGINWDVTTYKYNDEGVRVEKDDNGTVTKYLIDSYNHTGYTQVLEEWTDGVLTKTYIIGDDIIGEADGAGTIKYLLYDGQGSVRHHSNSNGNLIAYSGCDTFAYDAYGQRVDPLKDTVNEGLFYTGEQWDNSARMYYLRARYYDPLNGRFNQLDPYGGNTQDPQSLHKYLYVHNNPVNGIDPSGKQYTYVEQLSVMQVVGMMIADLAPYLLGAAAVLETIGAISLVLEDILPPILDAIVEGIEGAQAMYAAVMSNTRVVVKAIDDAAKSLKKTVKELQKFKFFPVIKRFVPDIFYFTVEALTTHPWWFMLTYNGAGNPQTVKNRLWVRARYEWMMAMAPPGYQLDEFPYACTQQGGPGISGGSALAKPVPGWQNLLQGGFLGAFARWTLKGKPQPFIVVPIPL